MNDERLRASAERGRRFREWCHGEDGLFEVFAAVERNYLKSLADTELNDQDTRERIYHRVCALRDLRKTMEAVIADGASAAAILEALSKKRHKRPDRRHKVMA